MRAGCLVLIVAGLLGSGCGGKSKPASRPTATASATGATSTATGATSTAAGDCNALGINPRGMREGRCTHAGITYAIVNENHALRLRSLAAKLTQIRTTSSLGGTQPATPQGRFVDATITLTNHLSLPQAFDRSGTQQAEVVLGGTVYKEATSVEKRSDPSSCLSRRRAIPAAKSETCEVVFDVPAAAAARIGKHGGGDLYLVDFGSDLASSPPPQTVGEIRLYR